jgi:glutamate/tyrosine decarboxylase-like PLP-dependent enzyme
MERLSSAMPDPPAAGELTGRVPGWLSRSEWEDVLDAARRLAVAYLGELQHAPVSKHASADDMSARFDMPLPVTGCPPRDAVEEWFARAEAGIVRSSGPRYFGFVTGGATPAALAGDWLASALDQNPATWLLSPAGTQTELVVIRWLLELFHLPLSWSGTVTTGATMANLSGLAAARQWASLQLGFDAARDGLGGYPVMPVISSTEAHQSAIKALGILGLGRNSRTVIPSHDGVIDLAAFDRALAATSGPAIVIANAGEVNTGAFDPIRAMAESCAAHKGGAWLHVDGAFGLYAALSPAHRPLLDGIDLADSVASDAHKWLNVPYDCGLVFVRDPAYLRGAFSIAAAYLGGEQSSAVWNALDFSAENSRRFRALSVWCALRSAGRSGYREIVERSISNAAAFGHWVTTQPNLELMAPVHLNIVCFRVRHGTNSAGADDMLNAKLVESIQTGGIAYVSGTRWRDCLAIRAAFDNWATTTEDVVALQQAVAGAVARLLTDSDWLPRL